MAGDGGRRRAMANLEEELGEGRAILGAMSLPEELVVSQVFVGKPALLGEQRGKPVTSAIGKQPVTGPTLELGPTGLEGDGQADLRVHGGVDKAVYVYPVENYPLWEQDGFELRSGRVGENVSSRGRTEADVRIGDVWRWGEALVQVSQPRAPCFKFGMHTGRKDAIPAMLRSGRCGWYLRVLETGSVPTAGTMDLVERDPDAPAVATLFAASFPTPGDGTDLDELRQMLAAPALAQPWRSTVVQKLARLEPH
jgi:MOSC domain-containing protein YiiM